jgi:hypothetical protein
MERRSIDNGKQLVEIVSQFLLFGQSRCRCRCRHQCRRRRRHDQLSVETMNSIFCVPKSIPNSLLKHIPKKGRHPLDNSNLCTVFLRVSPQQAATATATAAATAAVCVCVGTTPHWNKAPWPQPRALSLSHSVAQSLHTHTHTRTLYGVCV